MTKKAAKPLNVDFSSYVTQAPEIPVVVNPAIPDGEVWIVGNRIAAGPLIADKIVNIGTDPGSGKDETAEIILLNVRNCSACGGNHDGVAELPLPSPAAADVRHTHYYICPTTGQTVTIEHKE